MTGLRVVALDLAPARSGLARTHDSTGQPRLAVDPITTGLLPLHRQIDHIEYAVRRACGVPAAGGRPKPSARPDLVVIEGTFSRPGGSDYPLHAVRAVVLQWLHRQGIPYADIAPATLKVWATGSGATRGDNAVLKIHVVERILADYGRFLSIPRDDNCCDAVALLTMGLAAYGQPLAEVPQKQRRAIAAVTWPQLNPNPALGRSA